MEKNIRQFGNFLKLFNYYLFLLLIIPRHMSSPEVLIAGLISDCKLFLKIKVIPTYIIY